MSMRTRYEGSFYSVKGILYRIELLQEGFMGKASTVAFGSAPLEIEWTETDKLEPVQSSKATLTLFSDNDRQFVNLYTVKAGDIRLDE